MRLLGRDATHVLRERDFRLIFGAWSISVFGDFLVPVALAFAVLEVTNSATDLGLVLAARVLPIVVFVLAGGVWADRLPRQHLIVASNLVRGASQALLGMLLVTGAARLWEIAALQVVHGAATAFSRPAGTALVADVVPPARLQQANALLFLAMSVCGIAGPAVAGVLVVTAGAGWALVIDAGTFFGAAVLLARIRVVRRVAAVRQRFRAELAAGWHEVRQRRWLWSSIGYFGVFQLVNLSTFLVLGPVISRESLGGAGAWALIATAFGVGDVAGNLLALRFEAERPLRATFLLSFLTVPSLILLGLEEPALAIAATEVLGGVAVGYADAVWHASLQRHVPREALSRVSAYDWLGSTALRPIGLALAGPIAVAVGTETTLLGAAALSATASLLVLTAGHVRDVRRTPAEPAEREAVPAALVG